MGLSTVTESKTQRLEILSPEGCVDSSVKFSVDNELLVSAYRKMCEIRMFDERAIKLQRQGRLGTYPQILGQEASQVIPPLLLKPKDWLVPTYRGQGCYFARGMQMRYSLLYWAGDDRGVRYPDQNRDMIFAIPVGTHLTQVAGLAWASKLKGEDSIAMTYCGDGTSSKGDLHEALIFAGRFKLPVVYIIENNHWAISVPREKQAAAKTLAERAWAYGAFGLQADGNDALAVYESARRAVERARRGDGPTVLELETYRLGHHTTADDASRYRSQEEVDAWKRKDPIPRLRRYLTAKGLWDDKKEKSLLEETELWVEGEVQAYEATPVPNPLDMFAHNYETAPRHLIEQRAELARILKTQEALKQISELPPAEGRFP